MNDVLQTVDWTSIRQKIEAARSMTEGDWEASPEEKKRILRERAKVLAQPITEPVADEETLVAVTFLLAGETYAIELPFVSEVYPLREFTPLPSTPPFVLGILNVRGQIISVVDIRYFFELPKPGLSELNKVIILRHGEMEMGILADAVLGVQSIFRDSLQPALPTLTGIREVYLKGVTPERWVVLDGGRILSDKALIVQEQVEG